MAIKNLEKHMEYVAESDREEIGQLLSEYCTIHDANIIWSHASDDHQRQIFILQNVAQTVSVLVNMYHASNMGESFWYVTETKNIYNHTNRSKNV